MSFVLVSPSQLMAAAADVAGIGSAISAANAAALAPTSALAAAGADEVSAAVAALFSAHAGQYQQLGARAALFHEQFVQALTGAASAYASAEATNVEQQVLGLINAPTQALLGRPLIGNGADGTAANPNGGAGGLLYGNGGNGFSQTTAGGGGGTGGSAGLIGNGGNGGAGRGPGANGRRVRQRRLALRQRRLWWLRRRRPRRSHRRAGRRGWCRRRRGIGRIVRQRRCRRRRR
ncbi:Conserved protein of unknown function, PE-PGRS family protein PE_PGRS19 (part1) [Mycobacterium canettii CIPT 140070008]|nr:Conserved protein of unknown function, PE-PGRS family protein PE_PGRS19 (part1) [Mycobacterium canettii CIPT 140070008]